MSFSKSHTFDELNDSTTYWTIWVRAQSIWKGVTMKTNKFRGYNIIFFDDTNSRIHAFIEPQICPKFEEELQEGCIYIIRNFSVKYYNRDETNRAIRNEKHIYFNQDITLKKDSEKVIRIEPQSFDLFLLSNVDKLKGDNRFLSDVVGLLEDSPTKIAYRKEKVEKHNVKFTLTDGRYYWTITIHLL
ncbi:uncharacterized protein LOC141677115 [Apium graveolens]|uniref:uncharacterized protein LOC141677115 n=1 Tax=Apium graveolens TaxID=4045 RepID=UPI003D7AB808